MLVRSGLVDEHAVALPFDFLQRVTHRLQEDLVGIDDRAVQFEFDHRLRTLDRRDLPGVVEFQPLPVSDIVPGDDIALDAAIRRGMLLIRVCSVIGQR